MKTGKYKILKILPEKHYDVASKVVCTPHFSTQVRLCSAGTPYKHKNSLYQVTENHKDVTVSLTLLCLVEHLLTIQGQFFHGP